MEEGVVLAAGKVRHRQGRSVGELVARPDDEVGKVLVGVWTIAPSDLAGDEG